MPTNFNTLADEASNVGEKVSETVKHTASSLGRSAVDRIDENRDAAASGLEKAASALHERAQGLPGGEKITSLANAAAGKLSSGAAYVREHDVQTMMSDVATLVKNNPGPALAVAAVFGFLLGRSLTTTSRG